MTSRRWTLLLWCAAAAGLGAAAWLFLPRESDSGRSRPRLRIALVDVSASVARTRAWLPWVRAELRRAAEEAREAQDELAVISFADGVSMGFDAGAPQAFLEELEGRHGRPFDPSLRLPDGATRLGAALATAEGLLRGTHRPPGGRLTVLGPLTTTESGAGSHPGSLTMPSIAPSATPSTAPGAATLLARLTAAGTPIVVRAPPPPERDDLGLLELSLAPRVEEGAPLIALARLVLRRGTALASAAHLRIEVECDGVSRAFELPLALPDTDGQFQLPIDCGPAGFGRNEVRARCRLDSGPDPVPENDRAMARCSAAGARTLGVAVRPELRSAAEAWLAPAGRSALTGLQFAFFPPEELGAELSGLAALLTFDLSPGALPESILTAFVRRGGGWLALSGYGFLDDWNPGEASGPLHALLPCEPLASEAEPRDVVLLVDGSGSMAGGPFETVRAAALELVSAALPTDRVSLRFFTVRLEPEHLLKERLESRAAERDAARHAAEELLALRVPSGTTFLLQSLGELARTARAPETLALLLTDGWEREGLPDVLAAAEKVRGELADARVRLVVIGVGEPNLPLLTQLAGAPERVRVGQTLDDLRAVFHRELHGAQLAEGDLAVRSVPRAAGSLADEVSSEGGAARALPPLERYVRNRLRSGAEILWESGTGEPILALMRAGLGRVALFSSRPGAGWGSRYARPGLGEPAEFAGLLRWLARGPESGRTPEARLEEDLLRLRGLDPDTPPELVVRLRDARQPWEESLVLTPPAVPGFDVLRTREGRVMRAGWQLPFALFQSGGAELALPVQTAVPAEFAWREEPVELPGVGPGRLAAVPASTRSSRTAAIVLGASLGLLFLAGWATGKGQGVPGIGR